MEQLLELVVELIGLGLAQIGEPGPVAGQFRIHFERGVQIGIGNAVELKLEEQHARRKIGQRLIGVAHELGAVRIGRFLRILQEGKRADAAGEIAQRLAVLNRLDQTAGLGQFGQLPLVFGLEFGGEGLGLVHCGLEFGAVLAGIEIVEVPDGQIAELIVALLRSSGHLRDSRKLFRAGP